MNIKLISRPVMVDFPKEFLGDPRADQLLGTDAEKITETAGRTCYDSFGSGRGSTEYHPNIVEVGHGSVLEHAYFVFFITGVSRGFTHELVRHRSGVSISQRSTRYVDEDGSPWIKHPLFSQYLREVGDDELERRWDTNVKECGDTYSLMVKRLQGWLEDKGESKINARKQARGAARGVLGNALETELVWGANIRALRHIITMRGSKFADAEIREWAVALLKIMRVESPAYFNDFVIKPENNLYEYVEPESGRTRGE